MRVEQWWYTIPLRLRSIFRKARVDEELDEEIRDHLERQTAQYVARGLAPTDARAAALRDFGGVMRHTEAVRDTRGVASLEHLLQDVRFAVRVLVKAPVFTVVAVLSLALGIGANTAIFSMVQSVLLRPLPYPHAARVAAVFETDTHGSLVGVSKLDFQDWRRQSRSFAHLAAAGAFGLSVTRGGATTGFNGAEVSPELFEVLGMHPLLGTAFTSTNQSVVISEGFWKQELGGGPVIGRTLVVQDTARAIVGVMPARFDFPHGTQLWIPQDMLPRVKVARTIRYWSVVADLRPGVSIASAQAEMTGIAARLASTYPATNGGVGARVMSLQESLTGDARPTLVLLGAIAALVLLLACANLANLMLVRGVARRREMAVRTALGATRSRLRRQLLTESLLLAAAGAALSLPLALWSERALHGLSQVRSLQIDATVPQTLVFATAAIITVLTTLGFGMAPAVRATRVDLVTNLKEGGGRGATALGLSGGLIAAEVALATLLVVVAALTGRSLSRLERETLGFQPDSLLAVSAGGVGRVTAEMTANTTRFVDAVRAIPGVSAAAYADAAPFMSRGATSVIVEGEPTDRAHWQQTLERTVSDGYFRTLGIPLDRGRDFAPSDQQGGLVAIVNEAFARTYLSWRDPLGAQIAVPEEDSTTWDAHQRGQDLFATVVGVVGDAREVGLGIPPQPTAYMPATQHPFWAPFGPVLVRTRLSPANAKAALTAAARAAGVTGMPSVTAVSDYAQRSVAAPRVRALVLAAFAMLALVLAAIGVYGVTAHATAQRTREFGIRIALGARTAQVLAAASRGVALYLGAGLALGIVAALAAARLIRAFLYGIGPTDLAAFAIAGVVAAAMAAAAAWVPARRAARIDPTDALRAE